MLKVSSIFYSIQGEGMHAGEASIFIRLYGCNLSCTFCDDELHKSVMEELSYEEVYQKIEGYPSKRVIITGGEPTIYALETFISFLHQKGYFVSVETNGYDLQSIANADWITYSPKDWEAIESEGYDELKFIVDKSSPIEKILALKSTTPIFIQPQNDMDEPNMENVVYCIELVKTYPQRLRLSVQLHKFIRIP